MSPDQIVEVGGRTLKLTNLDKVLFPEDGYTKSDLIRFYIEVSPFLLRYLNDRPLTLKPYLAPTPVLSSVALVT